VAVIVLAVPEHRAAEVKHEWAFVAGVSRDAEIGALAEELVSRAVVKIVPIVAPSGSEAVRALAKGSVELQPPVACDTAAAQSGEAHFPVDDWKAARLHAWLVDARASAPATSCASSAQRRSTARSPSRSTPPEPARALPLSGSSPFASATSRSRPRRRTP